MVYFFGKIFFSNLVSIVQNGSLNNGYQNFLRSIFQKGWVSMDLGLLYKSLNSHFFGWLSFGLDFEVFWLIFL